VVERLRAMIQATPVDGYVGGCQAILAFDLADAIGRIHCPALVAVGDKDPSVPLDEARAMAAAIPGARLEVLPDAAHLAHLEQSDRFHAALDAFLGKAACGAQCDIP
jgi:3-oxoadipate enol-lactonase